MSSILIAGFLLYMAFSLQAQSHQWLGFLVGKIFRACWGVLGADKVQIWCIPHPLFNTNTKQGPSRAHQKYL
jgi:cytochrome b